MNAQAIEPRLRALILTTLQRFGDSTTLKLAQVSANKVALVAQVLDNEQRTTKNVVRLRSGHWRLINSKWNATA